ncbi:MAG: hypothetical protein ACQERN_04020 [Thermodesulfobacteriota bacterium]
MPAPAVYQLLAADRINIEFLNVSAMGRNWRIACCVAADKYHHVLNCTHGETADGPGFDHRTGVVALSVYPHKSSFHMLGRLLAVFSGQGFAFYQMAASTSMLTFVVDAAAAEEMADCLADHSDLPASHSPFRPNADYDPVARSLKTEPETVAPYVESKIKTYGIRAHSALTLCWMEMSFAQLAERGRRIQALEQAGFRFCYVSAIRRSDGQLRLFLLVDTAAANVSDDGAEAAIRSALEGFCAPEIGFRPHVGGLHFQGPHFGDRFGIADQAFSTLHQHSIPFLLAGCVGSSVYIVLDEDWLSAAESALSAVFEMP